LESYTYYLFGFWWYYAFMWHYLEVVSELLFFHNEVEVYIIKSLINTFECLFLNIINPNNSEIQSIISSNIGEFNRNFKSFSKDLYSLIFLSYIHTFIIYCLKNYFLIVFLLYNRCKCYTDLSFLTWR
jgi:hypothetical protein